MSVIVHGKLKPSSFIHSLRPHNLAYGNIFLIDVPPKVWRPKQQNFYKPLETFDDVIDDDFDYSAGNKTFIKKKVDLK